MNTEVNPRMNDLIEKMDIRLTYQRKIILNTLIENVGKHLSANEIYALIKDKASIIGMATIYRTIDILLKKGIVVKHDFGYSAAKYEIEIENTKNHHHLICKKCGSVIEASGLIRDDLYERLLEEKGFQCTEYKLKIFGYCNKCRASAKAN
jgi:Fur family ferric uptake transcriptional regulator